MRLLITGGGTGGHVYPALAIARGFMEKYPQGKVLYVGTEKGLEADIVPKAGLEFKTVTVQALPRKLSWETVAFGGSFLRGLGQARAILKQFRPNLVVGTGGYVCGPVVMLAALEGIPTLLHEQNALPGKANKLLARFVKKVAITFQEAEKYFPSSTKIKLTGLPIRPEILRASKAEAWGKLGLQPGKPLVLVTGGSQGARSLNQAMIEVYGQLQGNQELQILQLTGQRTYQETLDGLSLAGINWVNKGNIIIKPYLYNMEDALAAADLIICRAGATTLAEITAKGVPAILVPYPFAAENHQEYNARALESRGAALVIKDSELTGELLTGKLQELLSNGEYLRSMGQASKDMGRPEALDLILGCMEEIMR